MPGILLVSIVLFVKAVRVFRLLVFLAGSIRVLLVYRLVGTLLYFLARCISLVLLLDSIFTSAYQLAFLRRGARRRILRFNKLARNVKQKAL